MDDYSLKALEKKLKALEGQNKAYVSNFLTMEERAYLESIQKYYPGLNFKYSGKILNAERTCALIYSDYEIDFDLSLLKITYNNKYKEVTHRMILGSLMSLGINRDRVGDIVLKDGYSIVSVKNNLKDFIIDNLKTIGNLTCEVSEYLLEVKALDNGEEKTCYVSSLRVDNIISSGFNLARDKTLGLIKEEMVKINQKVVFKAFQNVKACDIISVAHFGRLKIIDCDKLTKSGHIVVNLKRYR